MYVDVLCRGGGVLVLSHSLIDQAIALESIGWHDTIIIGKFNQTHNVVSRSIGGFFF